MSDMLTGTIEHVIHHDESSVPPESSVGSISGSQASTRSLNNAASIFIVDWRLIWMNEKKIKLKWREMKKKVITSDDQFWTSAVKFDKHIATTDFVTEPKPTSSLTSIVSNVKTN